MPSYPGGREHLWVVITEPSGRPPEVVIASFSTDYPDKDQTVKLGPDAHPFITRNTIVFYPDATIILVEEIVARVNNKYASFHDDCSEDLLETVAQGLLNSPFTPRRVKSYGRAHI
jgi:hypothetical protein